MGWLRRLRSVLTLEPGERRARRERALDRWRRRNRLVRALSLAPGWPLPADFRRGTAQKEWAARFLAPDPRRGPLYVDLDGRAASIWREHPDYVRATVALAERLAAGEFDLLGSGPFRPRTPAGGIDWHTDPVSGRRWDPGCYFLDVVTACGEGSAVKLPWELGRCQQLLVLGQAWQFSQFFDRQEGNRIRRLTAEAFIGQVESFLEANPLSLGVHWASTMEVGLRALAWCAALALFRTAPELDDAFLVRMAAAILLHGRHLWRNLEIEGGDLAPHRFLSSSVGLLAVGSLIHEAEESAEWRRFGFAALAREMEIQVLPDGVDAEGSISCHRLAAELFLHGALLARSQKVDLPETFHERLARMLEFTAACTRPDGTVPQWGDGGEDRALPLTGYAAHAPYDHRHLLPLGGRLVKRFDLVAAGGRADIETVWLLGERPSSRPVDPPPFGSESRAFADAGIYLLQGADLALLISCGAAATKEPGRHRHNDRLSLSVWAAGREWITDPGGGRCTRDPGLSTHFRGTAAHATLQLGDREQQRLAAGSGGPCPVETQAVTEVLEWTAGPVEAVLEAQHNGFSTASRACLHRRRVGLDADRRVITVVDRLIGEGGDPPPPGEPERAVIRFPLAPGIIPHLAPDPSAWPEALQIELEAGARALGSLPAPRSRWALRLSDGEQDFWLGGETPSGWSLDLAEGLYSPRYGVQQPIRVVGLVLPVIPALTALTLLLPPRPGFNR